MFRALLCPSSGARYYNVDYHIDRFVLGLLWVGGLVRLGWSSVRAAARTTVLFYCTSYRLNIFRALLCLSSGVRYYNVDYHIDRFVLGLLCVGGLVRLGWSSVRAAG